MLYAKDGRMRAVWRVLLYVECYLILKRGVYALTRLVLYGNVHGHGADGTVWRTTYREHVFLVLVLWITAGLFALTWLFRRGLDRRDLLSLGLGRPRRVWYASVWAGVGLGVAPILLGVPVMLGTGQYLYEGVQWTWTPLLFGTAMVFSAFNEELLTRGYLLNTVRESGGVVAGVLVSSVIFWMLHAENPGMWTSVWPSVNLFLGGVVLAELYLLSGNLWFVTAAHWGWNAAQGVLFDIPVSGYRFGGLIRIGLPEASHAAVTGGEFGAEGSAVAAVPNAAFALLLLGILWRRGRCGGGGGDGGDGDDASDGSDGSDVAGADGEAGKPLERIQEETVVPAGG